MLELRHITKTFNTTGNPLDNRIALEDVSLTINDGEFITVIGGNGSGKSTLLNIIAGVLMPDVGQVLIDGKDITALPEYRRADFLGRVVQDPNLGTAGNMSIEENMSLAIRRDKPKTLKWGFDKQNRELFIKKLADLDLGLENRINQKVGNLSGGQRQAITLIMATLVEPKLLLLDEHTAALDPKTAQTVLNLTNQIVTGHNITTIMITHNMRDAIRYGNRLLMLNNGRIIFDVAGEEKKKLTFEQLLSKFEVDENIEISDTMLLSH
jgi:putative ABC transport system ATP-binding protein